MTSKAPESVEIKKLTKAKKMVDQVLKDIASVRLHFVSFEKVKEEERKTKKSLTELKCLPAMPTVPLKAEK